MRHATIGALGAVILLATVVQAGGQPAPSAGAPVMEAVASPPPGAGTGALHVFFGRLHVGFASGYEGCTLMGTVDATDAGAFQEKSVDGTRLEDCALTLSMKMTRDLKSWLRDQMSARNTPKEISLVRLDRNMVPVAALTLPNALISGLSWRRMGQSAKAPTLLDIVLKTTGSIRTDPARFLEFAAIPNNNVGQGGFNVTLDGVAEPVISISSLRMHRDEAEVGRLGSWTVSDVTIETPRPGSTWANWYTGVVIDRRSDERSVQIDVLKSNLAIGMTITLGGVGVYAADGNLDNGTEIGPAAQLPRLRRNGRPADSLNWWRQRRHTPDEHRLGDTPPRSYARQGMIRVGR